MTAKPLELPMIPTPKEQVDCHVVGHNKIPAGESSPDYKGPIPNYGKR